MRGNSHMEHEALCLTERRGNTQFQSIQGDDTRNTCTNIRHTRKHDESVLNISNFWNERVRDEDTEDSDQADRASYALKQHQRGPLGRFKKLQASFHNELVTHFFYSGAVSRVPE